MASMDGIVHVLHDTPSRPPKALTKSKGREEFVHIIIIATNNCVRLCRLPHARRRHRHKEEFVQHREMDGQVAYDNRASGWTRHNGSLNSSEAKGDHEISEPNFL